MDYLNLTGPERDVFEVEEQFIQEWGRMSSQWGINRTMAQIHALLFITGRPFSMDEIIDRLHISRGNASMNLRDLMEWNIARRVRRPGDRKDMYMSDSEPWRMVARVVRERKRRELDPTSKALGECLAKLEQSDSTDDVTTLKKRIAGLKEIFDMVDALHDQVMRTDETFLQTLKLFGHKED